MSNKPKSLQRCSPVQMRENLMMVEFLKSFGISFIPIPVKNDVHRAELVLKAHEIIGELLARAEAAEAGEVKP